MTKFELGEIGTNNLEIKQNADIVRVDQRICKQAIFRSSKNIVKAETAERMHKQKIVPYIYINKRLVAGASFRSDRNGATQGMKRAIQLLIDSDKLREIPKHELSIKFGTTQRAFAVSDVRVLD